MRVRIYCLLLLGLIFSLSFGKEHTTGLVEPLLSTIPSLDKDISNEDLDFVPFRSGRLPISEKGYYYLKAKLEIDESIDLPSIQITPVNYPYYLFVNGKEVFRWGDGEKSRFKSNYNAEVINIKPVINESGENEFVFCFFTDGETTPLPKFYVGDFETLNNRAFVQTFFNYQLIIGLVVAAFFASIVFLGYFFVSGKREIEVLFFVLSCFFFFTAYQNMMLSGQIFNELIILKLSRFSLLIIPFFLLRFVQSYTALFQRFVKLFWIPFFIAVSAGIYMFFLPLRNDVNKFFALLQVIVAIPELLIMLLMLLLNLKTSRRKDKFIILSGFIVLAICAIRDIYYSTNSLVPYVWIIPYGFFTQIFTIALSITIRQRTLYISTLDLKDKLETANLQIQKEAAKRERFLDTIASELRSPMNGLEERIQDVEKEKSLTFNSISGAFRRIRITLNNIFDYVAVRDGILRILDHDFNLYTTLDILNSFYFEMAKKKNLSFSMVYDKNFVPEFMHGDREHLVQVMDNLLHNAIKYTKEGGVSCTISYRKGDFIFSVSDTGDGMVEEGKSAIRKAISSGQYISFSEKYEGVGLGLAITDMIVRKMQGQINLESNKEKGTTILVSIPLMEKKELSSGKGHISGGKVLVVEDNKVNALIITKLLKKSGYEYNTVENGLLAVQEVQKNSYNVILMDVEMPVMDGLEATKKIRQFDQRTPIIAVTANGVYDDCIEAGMNDHLMKPVNFEYLKEILRKYTSQKVVA